MACEEFALNWNDHHETLVAVFEKLLERSTLVDCTIAAEGQYLKAHKVILSACSPYFELLFSQEKEKNPIIILKDIKFRELKAIIEFVYRGTVKIPENHLQDFVDAAETLQIKGLGLDQGKNDPRKRNNEFGNVGRKKDDFLACPNKRFKNNSLNKNEEKSPNLPSEVPSVSKNVTSVSHSLHEIERSVTDPLSLLPGAVSDTSAFVNVGQERHKQNFPCSTEQSVSAAVSQNSHYVSDTSAFENIGPESHEENFPCSTVHSSVLTETETVVKTEPVDEPVPESIVPDNLVEPKKEECEQEEITILDSDDGVEESLDADGIHDENSQELSEFPPSQETVRGDSYALDELEHSNTQGSQWSRCSNESQLASSSWQSGAAAGDTSTLVISPLEGAFWNDMHLNPTTEALASLEPGLTGVPKRGRRSITHVCNICGAAQTSAAQLAIHMKKHTEGKLFKCPQCGRKFTKKGGLSRHQFHHTGLRPYKCAECGKSFTRLEPLLNHKMIHTGSQP